ncbi:ubiquitin-conjugating enzyme E2 2 [Sphaceloma murrayae]|uniref:Ubiquitin-conjugating enzyme E2 2 n=1 Tax=Sphaceloma murrayae TaxID=2082308 RepID=A0A2K1QJU8_9PEZI|nr:ubiquitin-conjugating enzyme E2 2 [Sphaceloma murrayae]
MSFSVWDFVSSTQDAALRGHVLATSADSDDFAATLADENPLIVYHSSLQHLRKAFEDSDYQPPQGSILVQWHGSIFPELVPLDLIRLLNRQLLVGDLVVKASDDHQRGTVLKSETKCVIRTTATYKHRDHAQAIPAHFPTLDKVKQITANPRSIQSPPDSDDDRSRGNIPQANGFSRSRTLSEYTLNRANVDSVDVVEAPTLFHDVDLFDLRTPTDYQKGDPVMYQDWAGVIRSVVEEVTLRLINSTVVVLSPDVRVSQPGAQPTYSTYALGDMIAVRKADLRLGRWLFGAYDPNVEPLGVVAKIRVVGMTIDWQSHRYLDVSNLGPGQMPSEEIGVDEIDSGDYIFYDMQCFTAHPAKLSSHDEFTSDPDVGALCGPRVRFTDIDHARTKYADAPEAAKLFSQSRAANLGFDMNIYQVVDSKSFVHVQWQDGTKSREPTADLIYADFTEEDIYPGDLVCTRDVSESSGAEKRPNKVGVAQRVIADECIAHVRWFASPRLHLDTKAEYLALPNYQLGQLSDTVEEISIYDIVVPLGLDIGFLDNVGHIGVSSQAGQHEQTESSGDGYDWLGHVLENHMDGTYTIRLGASSNVRNIRAHIDTISLALDPERILQKDMFDPNDPYHQDAIDDDMEMDTEAAMEDDDMGIIMMGDRQEAIEYILDGPSEPGNDDNEDAWSTDDDTDRSGERMELDLTSRKSEPNTQGDLHTITIPAYALLESNVPVGHRFFEERGTPSAQALRKVMKEHAMLSTEKAMPMGIYVRSWESHCNLLRAVIIGASETPYAQCPFIFDVLLPEDFPRKPPKFHFYHWTTGNFARNAKINPNLYEDGVVCLSLLNTWPGQETEGWTPGQSTLLQALISIQSLILVQEPFYNEPGYDGKRDIPGTGIQSVAYSERAFLQSRGFLQHALTSVTSQATDLSLEGVEDIIRDLYVQKGGPEVLKEVLETGKGLIERSRASDHEAMSRRDGISLLSKGACLVLDKILDDLKCFLMEERNE